MFPSYYTYCTRILEGGRPAAPRGEETWELLNERFIAAVGEVPIRPRLNVNLAITEGLALIAGVPSAPTVAVVAPRASLALFGAQAAYGPRVSDQIPRLIAELSRDPWSRRATLILPEKDETSTPDLPCTQMVQYLIRNGMLKATVYLRSSDAIWGVPYDVAQFGLLTQAIARCIHTVDGGEVRALDMTFFLGSAHIYHSTRHLAPTADSAYYLSIELDRSVPRTWPEVVQWAREGLRELRAGCAPSGIIVAKHALYLPED